MRDYYVVQFFLEGLRMTSSMMLLGDAERLHATLEARDLISTIIFVCQQ